jgi:hypothetical protein
MNRPSTEPLEGGFVLSTEGLREMGQGDTLGTLDTTEYWRAGRSKIHTGDEKNAKAQADLFPCVRIYIC